MHSLQKADAGIAPDYEDASHPTRKQQETQGARATSEAANDATGFVSEELPIPLRYSYTFTTVHG